MKREVMVYHDGSMYVFSDIGDAFDYAEQLTYENDIPTAYVVTRYSESSDNSIYSFTWIGDSSFCISVYM